ncbi:hypothetical protein A3A63_02845 [Candidatus Gottesmanbacteria bacterium RIFCSPLOWO2_01_FULL_46_9]|uniref:Uncharacterized protein n=1 Tax=Candidatus Gottesmanbacteria bacterium RIFCSPLOWO2_01_FULL_46_9 TaxID=1798394 RepID=A0A1F6B3T4_9BACT|nr:MAG: hypothetical protein A3A63_02845 [Candidatus Gottesmanbacteria bacterium RIFCSPLOWO2_01_FULL_46_9]
MAKRKTVRRRTFRREDFNSWNFILFLTLSFILLVVMLNAISQTTQDVRSKAGLTCPQVTLPRAEDCPVGWKYQRDATNGCPTFACEAR